MGSYTKDVYISASSDDFALEAVIERIEAFENIYENPRIKSVDADSLQYRCEFAYKNFLQRCLHSTDADERHTIDAVLGKIGESDCHEAWGRLSNMTSLYLSSKNIKTLSPLAGLEHLTVLSLGWNKIENLEPLEGFHNLKDLDLSRNEISDLSPLSELKNLTRLELSNNKLKDLSPLAGLENSAPLN